MNKELENYVKQARATGQTNDQIKSALKSSGWSDTDISQALDKGQIFYGAPSTPNKYIILRSIWLLWFIMTFLYINLNLLGYPYVAGFIGLFVPYGMASLILLMYLSPFVWASLAFFIPTMIIADRKLNKVNFNLGKRILLNLLILLALTTICDLIRFTPFASWIIFIHGGYLH